jgi:hypothetical protein
LSTASATAAPVAARGRLVFWLGVGAAVWTTVLTVAVTLGAEAVTGLL